MSYKIPAKPSKSAQIEEIADFWEIQAILSPTRVVSSLEIAKILSLPLDEHSFDGIESEDDEIEETFEYVFQELNERKIFTANNYPFIFTTSGIKLESSSNYMKDTYLYLLLSTRFNMNKHKMQNGIDGTLLFEKICAIVASNYFDVSLNDSYVFGTATSGGFEEKVKELIKKIGEGVAYKNPNGNLPTAKDDGLDVVVWKNFADNRPGKLIAFGQCKTGTSWKDSIHKLRPEHFCDSWFYQSPILGPIPLVFLTDTLYRNFNFDTSQRGYLCFNRFRIMEHLQKNVPENLKIEIKQWVQSAVVELAKL